MMCVPDVMQSYLHLYQAAGARVSGAITNPQDLLKSLEGKPSASMC